MPLLPCPHCDQKISVGISQAGSEIICPDCKQTVPIPNLGELRRLAAATASTDPSGERETSKASLSDHKSGRRILFAAVLAIAGTVAIAGLFCLVRYLAIDVPATTESHIAEIKKSYEAATASMLVRQWQQMEKSGLDVPAAFVYKKMQLEKSQWGRNGLICLVILTIAVVIATALGLADSRRKAT